MADIFNFTDTWNSGATTFDAIKVNVTDTASDAASLLLNLSVGGSVKASVRKDGHIVCATEAIGGAVIGANALSVAGTVLFNSKLTITQGTANANVFASTGYSLTGSDASSMIDLAGTWNTSGSPSAIKLNITDTASAATSFLLEVQKNGTRVASIRKDGAFFADFIGATESTHNIDMSSAGLRLRASGYNINVGASSYVGFFAQVDPAGSSPDAIFSRQAAGVFQFGTTSANAAGSWLATSAGIGATPAISASTYLNFSAGTTAASQFRLAASTAPTSPVNGDVWFDGTDVKIRVSGATKTFTLT